MCLSMLEDGMMLKEIKKDMASLSYSYFLLCVGDMFQTGGNTTLWVYQHKEHCACPQVRFEDFNCSSKITTCVRSHVAMLPFFHDNCVVEVVQTSHLRSFSNQLMLEYSMQLR